MKRVSYERAKELFKNTGIIIADSEHGPLIIGICKKNHEGNNNEFGK